jgi:hypothetical protein
LGGTGWVDLGDFDRVPGQPWLGTWAGAVRSYDPENTEGQFSNVNSGIRTWSPHFSTFNATLSTANRLKLWWVGANRIIQSGSIVNHIESFWKAACLDLPAGNTTNGTPVQVWDCVGGSNQQWWYDGRIVHVPSGKCLDVPGWNPANGTPLQIWDCNGGTNQQFFLPGTYSNIGGTIVSAGVGTCIHFPNINNGTGVVMWQCDGSDNQKFHKYSLFANQL